MTYLHQVDAHLAVAQGRLAHARAQADGWPGWGRALARAFELAVAAVFIAWGRPRPASPKIHTAFRDHLAPVLDDAAARLILLVWASEDQGRPDVNVSRLLDVCAQTISDLGELAKAGPPVGWAPPPDPQPVGWDDLPEQTRALLREARQRASAVSPSIRVVLFGSRAAGQATPNSDYDILLVLPDGTPDWQGGQATGAVTTLGRERAIEIDVERVSASDWDAPDEVSTPLINQVKACGIEVPPPPPPDGRAAP